MPDARPGHVAELRDKFAFQGEFHAAAGQVIGGVEELVADIQIVGAVAFAHDRDAVQNTSTRLLPVSHTHSRP